MGHDLFVDFVADGKPLGAVGAGKAAFVGESQATVKGYPEHYFGVDEVGFLAADFPDGHVGIYKNVSDWGMGDGR